MSKKLVKNVDLVGIIFTVEPEIAKQRIKKDKSEVSCFIWYEILLNIFSKLFVHILVII